jgi:formiminotetrahydrofolate cyclodeaminase
MAASRARWYIGIWDRWFYPRENAMSTSEGNNQPPEWALLSVREFLAALAAKTPAPGGGATSALSGALAAAQTLMVVEYSIGKKSLMDHQSALTGYRARLSKILEIFLQLMDEDAAAYAQLSPWLKQSAADRNRDTRFNAALTAAIRAPQTIAALANELLECCVALSAITNNNLASDLWVAADVAAACGRSALRNVQTNLPLLPDAAALEMERTQTAELYRHFRQLTAQIPAFKI